MMKSQAKNTDWTGAQTEGNQNQFSNQLVFSLLLGFCPNEEMVKLSAEICFTQDPGPVDHSVVIDC